MGRNAENIRADMRKLEVRFDQGEISEKIFEMRYRNLEQELKETLTTHKEEGTQTELASKKFEPGTILDKRYRVLGELGQGGMGIVYHAEDITFEEKRVVALKVLPRELGQDIVWVGGFKREFLSASSLVHQNICCIYEFAEDVVLEAYFLVIEYLEGKDLHRLIRKNNKYTMDEAISIVEQIATGLDFAHSKGILHLDMKPANVMVLPSGDVKIMDFGLSKQIKTEMSYVSTVNIVGTPLFMAPEQIDPTTAKKRVSVATDCWALAVTLYEMLVGDVPFRGETELQLMQTILQAEPEPIATISSSAWKVIARALSKSPQDRYSSCGNFIKALQAASIESARVQVSKDQLDNYLDIGPAAAEGGDWVGYMAYDLGIGEKNIRCIAHETFGKVIVDMTTKGWQELPFENQRAYVEAYQKAYAKQLQIPIEQEISAGKISFHMMLIPPGRFWMGMLPGMEEGTNDHLRHKVVISSGFLLSTFPTTQQQWYEVTCERPWLNQPYAENNPLHAVSYVSWQDIHDKFLNKLSGNFNIPSEAQWEYAARAGTLTKFYWGDMEEKIAEYGCYRSNSEAVGQPYAQTVGQKMPNNWGLYDMSGNVYEWCEDWKAPYGAGEQIDPVGPIDGEKKIGRGGHWNSEACYCSSYFRGYGFPTSCGGQLGFRIQTPIGR